MVSFLVESRPFMSPRSRVGSLPVTSPSGSYVIMPSTRRALLCRPSNGYGGNSDGVGKAVTVGCPPTARCNWAVHQEASSCLPEPRPGVPLAFAVALWNPGSPVASHY